MFLDHCSTVGFVYIRIKLSKEVLIRVNSVNVISADIIRVVGELEHLTALRAHMLEVALHDEPTNSVRVVVRTSATNNTVGLRRENHSGLINSTEGTNKTLLDSELRILVEDVVLNLSRAETSVGRDLVLLEELLLGGSELVHRLKILRLHSLLISLEINGALRSYMN